MRQPYYNVVIRQLGLSQEERGTGVPRACAARKPPQQGQHPGDEGATLLCEVNPIFVSPDVWPPEPSPIYFLPGFIVLLSGQA